MSDNTPLGDRMKRYERSTTPVLPRRTYLLMRLDGRAFHTYLRNAARPFDHEFRAHMSMTAQRLCEEIAGARFAYTQSDEISILVTDFDTTRTEPWFGGNMNKLVSVSAGVASAYMMALRAGIQPELPVFDCRPFTISDAVEVANYFVWRQRDAVRNSVQMVGQHHFTPSELHGRSTSEIQQMLEQEHSISWHDFPADCKRGRLVQYVEGEGWVTTAAPFFRAEPGTELSELIPRLPLLWV